MERRHIAFVLVALIALVIAGCAASLAEADDDHRAACDDRNAWGPVKSATLTESLALADRPTVAVESMTLALPARAQERAAPEGGAPPPSRVIRPPRIPRAPPARLLSFPIAI
jgi:hypothetical protein